MDVLIVSPKFRPINDGLSDYTFFFYHALKEQLPSKKISLVTSNLAGIKEICSEDAEIYPFMDNWKLNSLLKLGKFIVDKKPAVVLVQYVPYMYGRAGINFFLPFFFLYMRFLKKTNFHLMAHEINYPFQLNLKAMILSLIHLWMFFLIGNSCSKVFFSTDYFTAFGKRVLRFNGNCISLPVGTSIMKSGANLRQFSDHGRKNIIIFGAIHPSKDYPLVLRTLNEFFLHDTKSYRLKIIGVSKEKIIRLCHQEKIDLSIQFFECTEFLGHCTDEEVSRQFMNGHLSINYFVDGISARRTTVMAALSHGVPVLSTMSERSDAIFHNRSFIFTYSTHPGQFNLDLKYFLERYKSIDAANFLDLSKLATRFAEDNFSWIGIVKKYVSA